MLHTTFKVFSQDQLQLVLSEDYAVLLNEIYRQQIENAIGDYLKLKIRLTLVVGEHNAHTPAEKIQRLANEQQQLLFNTLKQNANVQILMRNFDGVIVEGSLKVIE